jgi:tetratricopeptide (TPR) repeat protein
MGMQDDKKTFAGDVVERLSVLEGKLSAGLTGQVVLQELRSVRASATGESAAAFGYRLIRAGLVTQAEVIFHTLCGFDLTRSSGLSGLAEAAAARKLWSLSIRRWEELVADSPRPAPHAILGRARCLDELGRSAEVAEALEEFARQSKPEAAPLIDLFRAQAAMRRRDWSQALAQFESVARKFPAHSAVWVAELGMSNTLLELRRAADAEKVCRRALVRDTTNIAFWRVLMRALSRQRRQEDALDVFATSPYSDSSLPALLPTRFEALMLAHRFDEARSLFHVHLNVVAGIESIEMLFEFNPRLNEGWARTSAWIGLARQLSDLPLPTEQEAAAAFDVMGARLKLALRDHKGFVALARIATETGDVIFDRLSLRKAADAMASRGQRNLTFPKVFGIGLPKTATTSMATALTQLGIETLHWTNPITNELFCDDDLSLFDGFTDWPVCQTFEKYFYLFPNSKFVYTVRPIEDWRASVIRHWTYVYGKPDLESLIQAIRAGKEFHYGSRYVEIYWRLIFDHKDLSDAFRMYDTRVRQFFADKPKSRFLEFNPVAGDGWPKLCEFLGVDPPAIPFPFENSIHGRQ